MSNKDNSEIRLDGIGGSPGICIGKAYLVDQEGVEVVEKYHIEKKYLQKEKNRFKAAVKKAMDELHVIIENTPEIYRQPASILETHVVLLKDKMLYGKTIETIEEEQVNAEWALRKIVANVKSLFRNMEDAYLKERVTDIVHVSDRILRNLVGVKQVDIENIDKRVILVAHDLSPAETSQINLERIKGFVTDRGGRSSHTSIIARTLEIPAVQGVDSATRTIANDDLIIVDGTIGSVIVHPTKQTLADFNARKAKYESHKVVLLKGSRLPAKTNDGFQVPVMANIELPEEVLSAMDHGGDGIGLYRTEFQYLSRRTFPGEEELFEKYKDVVKVMAPKPVVIRTLDINGDKALANSPDLDERNPALGLRAIRYCLRNPDIFQTQLRAILRAASFGNARILFPMISSNDELYQAKQMLNRAADSLEKEGVAFERKIAIGILIEVPSAVVMADVMAKEVDFFSIGTNDLIQYSFAIDRENRHVSHLYRPLHPAIIRMIKQVSDVAGDNGIKTFMCGEMAGDPIHIPILLGLGMDELSMNPQAIPAVKRMIRSLSIEDNRMFIKNVLKQDSAVDIVKLVQDVYCDSLSESENVTVA